MTDIPDDVSQEVTRALRRAVVEVTGNPDAEAAEIGTLLTSLEIDSLGLVEIGMLLEEQLGVFVDAEQLKNAMQVGDVVRAFSAEVMKRSQA
jgi:acyl carrier protein